MKSLARFFWLTILCCVYGCQFSSSGDRSVRAAVATAQDGLEVAYDVRGRGSVALVFVHCWSCDREFWREQVDVFKHDYRVVTLDLGGHGQSGIGRQSWTVRGLAQDVVAVVDDLRLQRVILVGHSMGGPVALEASRLLKGRVLGIVAIDTLHDADFEFPAAQADAMAEAFDTNFESTMAGAFAGMAAKGIRDDVRDWIVAKAVNSNKPVAVALMRDFANLDMPTMFREAKVPIRAINAAPSPGTPRTNIEGNRQYADFDVLIMNDVGHFIALERPAELNRLLASYIEAMTK